MTIRPTTPISVDGLEKRYGSRTAVRGISFEVAAGETLALLGPNGAGKSTTIEILEGYRGRSAGKVEVLGTDPERGGLEWRARLGIVLQSSAEPSPLTVREQLQHFASLYPNPRSLDEVLAAVGLEARADTRIKALSGGQRRRVDVALGIIGRPELVFLDEPTTGFDPEARRQFWELIRTLKDEGTSILLTTHYLDEAANLADRVAVIAGGILIDVNTVDQLGPAEARIPQVRWQDASGSHLERSHTPGAVVQELMRINGGVEPAGLEVIRPSLEDVYLELLATTGAPVTKEELV